MLPNGGTKNVSKPKPLWNLFKHNDDEPQYKTNIEFQENLPESFNRSLHEHNQWITPEFTYYER
jgi:hypothetical protein